MLVSGKRQVDCQPLLQNGICAAFRTASSAVQGLAALEQLCEKCRTARDKLGEDPCSSMSASVLKGSVEGGRVRFKRMEMELQEISDSIKAAIEATGDDPDRHQVLGLTLRTVNNNLKTLRTLKVGNLNFDPKIVEAGLLQHDGFFNEMAQKLDMSFKARGYNSRNALQLTVYNPGDDTVTLRLPAGALFEPCGSKKCQNLVLRDATSMDVEPGQRKTNGLWAFCGNSNRSSPYTDLEPTDYVLKCDLKDQASVWEATRMYER